MFPSLRSVIISLENKTHIGKTSKFSHVIIKIMYCRLKVFEGLREKERARNQSGLCTKAGLRLEMWNLKIRGKNRRTFQKKEI